MNTWSLPTDISFELDVCAILVPTWIVVFVLKYESSTESTTDQVNGGNTITRSKNPPITKIFILDPSSKLCVMCLS